jgi:hypothetical protein
MDRTDVVGARASNAGDDFHILWALSHAVRILDPSSNLSAVTVEGVPVATGLKAQQGAWDGVDVGLFYGGESMSSASRVELQQLKYSTTSPTSAWTVARLCHSTRRVGNNSVIARLAKAYVEARRLAAQLSPTAVVVKLVSNQPIHDNVLRALTTASRSRALAPGSTAGTNRKKLRQASGLAETEFAQFANALDFGECQGPSRFDMHLRVVAAIGQIAASESRQAMLELRNVVYTRMLPDDQSPITRAVLLGALFVGDPQALLPCPSQLKPVEALVARGSVITLAQELQSHQRVCLHGEGGSGKTTVLQDLKHKLPSGSELVVFDCYGGGRYLDSDGQRHLSRHALLHLCNEISARLGVPMLVTSTPSVDYVREFSSRLRMAAEVLRARDVGALLVIAIDAADNSVTAAKTRVPPERSFVHDVAELGDLPTTVRIVVAARTGRLDALRLPAAFKALPLAGFNLSETAEFARQRWKAAPDRWIEDLQFLSDGNPRVISYAFDYAGRQPRNAVAYLRPSGKQLALIFGERVKEALRKGGDELEFGKLCAALVVLARPVPVKLLGAVLGVSEAHVQDLCNDLAPGLRRDGHYLTFADEDFEAFISERADAFLPVARQTAAAILLAKHGEDEYCAEHVAAALLAASDGAKLLQLAQAHPEPRVIKDPVRRREVQLHRLKLAMRVARLAGQRGEAILVLLRGARALRTDEAVRKMLTDNVDLSARFAQRSLRKTVLQERKYVGLHGRTLCHLMLDCAVRGDALRARDWRRQFMAWLESYFERRKAQKDRHPEWKLDQDDLAAEGEAVLRAEGPRHGVATLRRWKPKTLMPRVIDIITRRLLASGEEELVEAVLGSLQRAPLWDVTIRVPLALAGGDAGLAQLQANLGRWVRRGWLGQSLAPRDLDQSSRHGPLVRLLLTGAEVVVAQRGIVREVRQVLEVIASPSWRTRQNIHRSSREFIDATLRAHTLLELLDGRDATVESYLGPAKQTGSDSGEAGQKGKKNHEDERVERVEKFVRDLLPIYSARAKCLVPWSDRRAEWERFGAAVAGYARGDYSIRDDHDIEAMRDRIGQSIAAMQHVPEFGGLECAELAYSACHVQEGRLSREELSMLRTLSLHSGARTFVLEKGVAHAVAVKNDRAPATDRAERLVQLARLISPFSPSDGEALFADASAVLEDIDVDSIFHLEMLGPFARTAIGAMSTDERRVAACQIAELAGEFWGVLGDHERFPWESLASSLATLDLAVAFGAAGRWDDAGLVRAHRLIPDILTVGLEAGSIAVEAAVPLLCLGVDVDSKVLDPIAEKLSAPGNASERPAVAEELARLTVMATDGHDGLSEVRASIHIADPDQSTPWVRRGRDILRFFDAQNRVTGEVQADSRPRLQEPSSIDIRAAVLQGGRYTSAAQIEATLCRVEAEARRNERYVDAHDVLQEIRRSIKPVDRRAHLDALALCDFERRRSDLAAAIAEAVSEWAAASPSVASWCHETLPSLVAQRLPDFYYATKFRRESAALHGMWAAGGLPNDRVCESLLEGLELHANEWDAASVYGILELLAEYIAPVEAADALARHLAKEVADLKRREDVFEAGDIPDGVVEAVGRLLYAMLGDADLRVRWGAAHALRVAARLSQNAVVDVVVEQWPRSIEHTFRDQRAPFYWLAARLWLLIAMERIASESPGAVAKHGRFLFLIATDASFPHLLCQRFAKGAVDVLLGRGLVSLNAAEEAALGSATKSVLPAVPSAGHKAFGRFGDHDGRRFQFDSTDTLPYWYDEPLQLFADVSGNEFLDVAERWVVDHWKADTDVWIWANEPRKHRFQREPYSSSHRHGSLPTIERAHTHLEWHAMWCTVGELLLSKPLAVSREDRWRDWDYWWSRCGLTEPPHWLSDLRVVKPLEARLWYATGEKDEEWLRSVRFEDLLAEVVPDDPSGEVVVAGYVSGSEGKQRSTMNISSALVSPETASALVRALQSIGNAWDYKIPEEGEHMEIDEAPYRLVGWLCHPQRDTRLDDDDVLRREVSSCAVKPGDGVSRVLGLVQDRRSQPGCWVGPDGDVKFRYVAWSDDMSDATARYSSGFLRSYGHRLTGSRSAIQDLLVARKMDLIVEVDLTRRTGDGYGSDDSQESKEASYDFVVVLRRDGRIEGADGCLGTWTVPRQATRAGRRRGHTGPVDGTSPGGTDARGKKR